MMHWLKSRIQWIISKSCADCKHINDFSSIGLAIKSHTPAGHLVCAFIFHLRSIVSHIRSILFHFVLLRMAHDYWLEHYRGLVILFWLQWHFIHWLRSCNQAANHSVLQAGIPNGHLGDTFESAICWESKAFRLALNLKWGNMYRQEPQPFGDLWHKVIFQ